MSAKSGGPTTCTRDLLDGLYDIQAGVDLLTVSTDDIVGKGRPWLKEVPCDYKTPLGLSKNIDEVLAQTDYDVYHANALWSGSSHATCRTARKKGKPYILTTHGMLYPTALANKWWKKKPMLLAWFNHDIHAATCLHATCQTEADHCREFGYKGPIAVIPNAVVIPEFLRDFKRDAASFEFEHGYRTIGFLGRLDPIKKVENLIYALALVKDTRIKLEIMGKYDEAYEQWLKQEVKRLDLEDRVEFVGFVPGNDRYYRLARLSAIMLPSAQENFGMIVPEALLCNTPVYASFGTPWRELNERGAGWWRNNSPESLAEVITQVASLSNEELLEMGRNGRALIEERYEQHMVVDKMKRLYEWALKRTTEEMSQAEWLACRPDFVQI